MKPQIDPTQLANQLLLAIEDKNAKLDNIFSKIEVMTEKLDEDIPVNTKYEIIVSMEYLLVKARLSVEFESLKVKHLCTTDIPVAVKAVLQKRDQYLAQASLKLTSIREDIANLQKVVYTSQNLKR